MKYIRLLSPFFCVAILVGCATVAKGPSYTEAKASKPKPGYATIYVMRDYAEPTAWGAEIRIGGSPLTTLNQKGFTWVYSKPGKTEVRAVWSGMSGQKDSLISIDTEASKTYYLELTGISQFRGIVMSTVFFKMGSGLNEMRPEAAVSKLETCCSFQKPGSDTL